jgi:G:T-mismatch repair DNA endonuclease (very short patch repair protein)
LFRTIRYGEIDIFFPIEKIAVFVDGTIWHGDPEFFSAEDVLPLRNRIVSDVWEKDQRNNEYLRSEGNMVLRFWEGEILSNIEGCLETILSKLGESTMTYATEEVKKDAK